MRPMLASPTERPPAGSQWRHEIKWDGIRTIVTVTGGRVGLRTRSGKDCSERFPEIVESHLRDYDDLVLDGEIISLVDGLPDFRAVMHRLTPGGVRGARAATGWDAARLDAGTVRLVAFDVLRAAGHDVVTLPWSARRELLVGADLGHGAVSVPDAHTDGAALFAATAEQGLEGVVSKRVDSLYRPGMRSEDWQKSVHRRSDSFVIGGWRPVAGTTGSVGSLLLGDVLDGRLRYRGRAGTGISAAAGGALLDVVTPTPRCPFEHPDDSLPEEDRAGTHWVRPDIMVDITYLHHSVGGRLRQPVYKGLRLDLAVPHE